MGKTYKQMDKWSSEQVAEFKEQGRRRQVSAVRTLKAAEPVQLVAEGDSWFDYLPGTDIIDCLRNYYNYEIDNYAHVGDTLENMIYGTGINRKFQRTPPSIDMVLKRLGEVKPKVFLFSGGGNDVAGDEFESYLNHKLSGLAVLRQDFLGQMINVIFRKYYEDLIQKVAAVSPDTHIITHGYGRTVPTGVGVDFLVFTFAGPWLRPALAKKGIFDTVEQRKTAFAVIDAFNDMLADVAAQNARFHCVDLRKMIDPDNDWVNELHLHNSAYARVADRIHREIQSLP